MSSPDEIWLANIPFTDGRASKIRPVLVLWLDAADCVVSAVTSAPPRSPSDVSLVDWQAAGKLSIADAIQLKRVWAQQIQLHF